MPSDTTAVAIIGLGAIMPDAPNAETFWRNVSGGRYSITEVDAERWDPALYYDPDPRAPEKTYSTIGGWVRDWEWDPLGWKLPLMPKVTDAMDEVHKWGVACTRMALADAGWPEKPLDLDRTATIIGNALSGEKHYLTALRISFPELARELARTPSFAALPADVRTKIEGELHANFADWLPVVTEDTMPGELSNCIAGRIANLFNFHGPNFTTDAACASALAAVDAAIQGLVARDFDVALAGGVDRNMGASTFVKFCAIGALSPSGTRPYADGADGFVMGEGAALFLLKRLADAERDGDRVYAVIRGVGGSSDGRGKGITAPNPIGQRFAIQRAWRQAGLTLQSGMLIEGHGTSTRAGDLAELHSLGEAFASANVAPGTVALGSVKSNIGHLKAAAGAAGLLKTTMALHHKLLPPSINFERPNPNIDWGSLPFAVNTELRDWEPGNGSPRTAGVSAFGFGGTNFHVVLEEHVPGRLTSNGRAGIAVPAEIPAASAAPPPAAEAGRKAPVRGALVLGAPDRRALAAQLRSELAEARQGRFLPPSPPSADALRAPERIAIDYGDGDELIARAEAALRALETDDPNAWLALRGRGIFRGSGAPGKVAFLYTGQGSQYANMLAALRRREPIVSELFDEADRIMAPLLEGRRLSDIVFVDPSDPDAMARAEAELMRTEITQPAVLTVDNALTQLLAAYDIRPDMVMGHSLGEYGALVAAGSLTFASALEAVSARGREMASLQVDDPGAMAAVMAPLEEVEAVVAESDGYVVIANVNSLHQVVLGGATGAVLKAVATLTERGHRALQIPVSHAFHTSIVAPASGPLRTALVRLGLRPPQLPIVANVDGELYPSDVDVSGMLDILARQVASPVQFVKGLRTLYAEGARIFVEVGPKRALQGFASDVLGDENVLSLATNHPKPGDEVSFNHALCGLWAAGLGVPVQSSVPAPAPAAASLTSAAAPASAAGVGTDTPDDIERLFAEFLDRSRALMASGGPGLGTAPVAITGAALGLPGAERLFDDANLGRLLDGAQGIDVIPTRVRREMLDKHITRLVKGDDGTARFETIDEPDEVIKLAARAGIFDLGEEFGVEADRLPALGRDTGMAIAAGIDALRDAGIPLVQHYKTTTKGTQLPDRWMLPEEMRDDTGVIFASAFPGLEEMTQEVERYTVDRMRRERLAALESLRLRMLDHDGTDPVVLAEVERRIHDVSAQIEREAYTFDRRFIFRVLSMGHSQFAELIGARGPNTQVNSACASTTQAVALAEDWIRLGRCRRVIVVAADDATSDTMLGWIGAGFLASGAAATDEVVEEAALPFDERRHGMIVGMGAAAIVVEHPDAPRERGIAPICEVLGSVTANSAFHGTRLDVQHIRGVMEDLVRQAEARGLRRDAMAPEMVFVSHETYTPARGGSAAAEIHALRAVFGASAERIVIANTKGLTGHPMGVGLEDVVAVKALETGVVPPVPNFRDPDPELGVLNLSHGGAYPIRYALRLAAGFGSQISMLLLRWVPTADGRRRPPDQLGYAYRITDRPAWEAWLRSASGTAQPRLEVVQHRLRVADQGPASNGHAPVVKPPVRAAAPAAVTQAAPPPAPAVEGPVQVAAPVPATPATQPAAAAPAPEPTAPAPDVAAPAGDTVLDRVLRVVAEQTGYPAELLDPELDLEADLGIDTVKQAEVFAAIREAYGIERDDTLKLRDYPTLNHVVAFVHERAPQMAAPEVAAREVAAPQVAAAAVTAPEGAAPQVAAAAAPAMAAPAGDTVLDRVLEVVAEQTGYPAELLDPELDLEADLGIDTVKQAEVFAAIREAYGIGRDDSLQLRDYPTLSHVVAFVHERAPKVAAAEVAAREVAAPELAAPEAAAPQVAAAAVAAPEVAAPEVAAAAAPEVAAPAGDTVLDRVLAVVAEQTGYPAELLDPALDLEADLGVDTVKQAEVFAAIRAAYGIERDDTLQLRDYPTLNHVVAFVHERAPEAAAPDVAAPEVGAPEVAAPEVAAPEVAAPEVAAPEVGAPEVAAPEVGEVAAPEVAAPGSFPRRVPVPVLRPPLDQCVPTGVELGGGARVVLMPDAGGVGAALGKRLRKLGAEVLTIGGAPSVEELEAQLAEWGPIAGVYWLPGLDPDPDGSATDALHVRVKLLAAAMRKLDAATFLVAATRIGGRHGYGAEGAASVLGGAVTGFTKALARERTETLIKAVDFAPSRRTAEPADLLIAETLRDPGAVEVGHADGLRWTVGLLEQPTTADQQRAPKPDDVLVITGAAGSIVSAITADLARAAGGGTFHLLDRVPAPDRKDPDLERFATDRNGLKSDLAGRIRERGEKATPKLVERELARIERARCALDAIEAIEQAGGSAEWHQVDLTDAAAVREAIGGLPRIDALMHAAGVEISHFLPDKPQTEYDLVFDVKAHGWLNLLDATRAAELRSAVAFSSIAGRFGNGGQTDYSAANDLLCKSVARLNAGGETRAVALDWTAWSGIGMASRGSIPKMMEVAGIDMLPPDVGVPVVRRELTAAGPGGEVLVAGALGMLLEERHPTGGFDVETVPAIAGPMTGRIAGVTLGEGIRMLTELDPARQAFLDDHRIDGIPVLPGVMGMEGFAEAARSFAPGFEVVALEDVELLAPFKFYRDEPRTLELRAQVRDAGDGTLVADCELIGRRTLPGRGEQETRHFTGRARLAHAAQAPPATAAPGHDQPGVGRDAVYRIYFHGPAYQVLDEAWRDDGAIAGRLAADLPPDHEPQSTPTAFAPRLIELCFQTAGVWEIGSEGRLALPTAIARVTRYAGAEEPGRLCALVTPRPDGGAVDADVIDEQGRVRVRLEGYRTIELPSSLDPEALAAIRAAMGTS